MGRHSPCFVLSPFPSTPGRFAICIGVDTSTDGSAWPRAPGAFYQELRPSIVATLAGLEASVDGHTTSSKNHKTASGHTFEAFD
jgi:hypothetical protein